MLSSLPRLRFSSHCGEFAAITFGKDEVLLRANGPIVSSGTVQETYSEPKDEVVLKNEWGGDIFFSHGSSHNSSGVCILTNPKWANSVDEFHCDSDGRIVFINISLNKHQFSICNVYAQVKPTEEDNFCSKTNSCFGMLTWIS